MAQNNLFMEDDNLRLYVDVQPLVIDVLENSKNSAAASALQAAQSEEAARGWKNDIEDYKTGLELFYAQATDGITNSYNTSISGLSAAKSTAINDLNTQKNSIQSSLSSSLNSAINSIRTNGQSYVDQAYDYAEEAKRTVDNRVSKDHLNQSKGLLTGSVSTDEEVFADIKKYAHSTFDASKFTKVGSPIVATNGIASGFTDSNYLKLPEIIDWSKPFVIECFTTTIYSSKYNQILLSFDNNDVDGLTNSLTLTWNSGHTAFDLAWNIGGIYNVVNISNLQYSQIYFELIYDGTNSYTIRYKENKNDAWNIKTSTSSNTIAHTELLIIGDGLYRPWEGSIDLKQSSITVDGVEVFSGNKTGTDTHIINNSNVSIPYTLSNTGSKIVNALYRDRVSDIYEQFGYAPYYTLDEHNGNFTLPMGEVYGMIEKLRELIIQRTS